MTNQDSSFNRRAASAILICLVIVLLAGIIWQLRVLLIDLLFAVTLASAITPIAEVLEKKGISRTTTVIITYGCVAIFYTCIGMAFAQPLKEQAGLFISQLPHYANEIRETYGQLLDLAGDKASMLNIGADDLRTPALKIAGKTLDLTTDLMSFAVNTILVLFLASYFVVEAKNIWKHLLLWVPPDKRERAGSLISPLAARMGGYVRGQILVSSAVAFIFASGLTIIGVKYGLLLGLLAGLLNLMPFVGSIIATTFALFIAANQSLLLCGLTALLFFAEQIIESNFIVPHLLGKQVDMHPLIVLLAILSGATLCGAPGALAAVPTTAALLFLAQEFYFKPLNQQEETAS